MAPFRDFEHTFAGVMSILKHLQIDAATTKKAPLLEIPNGLKEIYDATPLNEGRNEIRLLTLDPGRLADDIHCSLTRVSLDDENDYEALSYTWGDAKHYEPILVDDRTFPATTNLEAALRNMRHPDNPRILWVDAICS